MVIPRYINHKNKTAMKNEEKESLKIKTGASKRTQRGKTERRLQ
jgi:hypothetical protein